jgi:hypothetical protein
MPDQFWKMSPVELHAVAKAYRKRQDYDSQVVRSILVNIRRAAFYLYNVQLLSKDKLQSELDMWPLYGDDELRKTTPKKLLTRAQGLEIVNNYRKAGLIQ